MRGEADLASGRDVVAAAKAFAKRKFLESSVVKAVEDTFKSKDYRRVFIHGSLTKKAWSQLDVLRTQGIECKHVGKLVREARGHMMGNRLQRAVEMAGLLIGGEDACSGQACPSA